MKRPQQQDALGGSHKQANPLALNLGGLSSAVGGASQTSLVSSYRVPAIDGRLICATPLKLALKYRPPTIAVVYKMERSQKTIESAKSSKRRDKKYVHEIVVDALSKTSNLDKLTDKLLEEESMYLNPQVISKSQVRRHCNNHSDP